MAENARTPVAIRIVRPYDSEEAFLESELETVGKTSVILIGAHARPQGVILRFEVTLQSGQVVLRGEGRVLQHKESAFRGQSGLALRFTRLDPKSKALVDRAAAIREARLPGSMPPMAIPAPPESSSSPISIPDPEPTPPPRPPPIESRPPTKPPPLPRPSPIESRPPTKPPPSSTDAPPPTPLVAMPSFAPMPPPSNIPSHAPSAAPVPPNATLAPDPMLAQLLTAGTPPPPPTTDLPTSPPAGGPAAYASADANADANANANANANADADANANADADADANANANVGADELPSEEAKTRPGKVPQLLMQDANVHATTTVAAPPLKDAEPPPLPLPPPVARVADREALLARLRERRASMSDDTRNAILNKQR